MGRKVGEIGEREHVIADPCFEQTDLLMRQLQKLIEKAEFIHCFERRRMNRVTAKIPEEIGVLFENERVHACAGERACRQRCSSGTRLIVGPRP
jgi:hypothetical protein